MFHYRDTIKKEMIRAWGLTYMDFCFFCVSKKMIHYAPWKLRVLKMALYLFHDLCLATKKSTAFLELIAWFLVMCAI